MLEIRGSNLPGQEQPPAAFCEAVAGCPEPGTDALPDALRELGGPELAAEFAWYSRTP